MAPQRKTLARKPATTSLPPAALQALIDRHEERGPIELYAPLTKVNMRETEAFWKQFCLYMSYGDPDDALKRIATAPSTILGYLVWRVDESKFEGHRRSTVRTWWKRLSQLYLNKFKVPTSSEARKTVSEALRQGGYMIKRCRLNPDGKEKPVVGSDDYYDILFTLHTALLKQLYIRNERQRFRLWLFEHIAGYTGSRPGALVSRRQDAVALKTLPEADEFATVYNDDELLKYKHCTLSLLPGEDGREFGTWALEVQLRNTKGGVGEGREPVTYSLLATQCLAQCPIMSFVTQAFDDEAFKSQYLQTPEQFWTLKIPSHKQTLQLQWKDSILDTPIFRNDDGTTMRYDQLRERLVRLGTATGYPEVLTTYCTRRGFVNAIHGKVTSAEQNQAMNHSTTVFERHYLAGRLASDVQNTFLGLPTQEKMIKIFSSMRRSQDRARPTRLTVEEVQQIFKSSENIQELHKRRLEATARCQNSFGSVTRSKGSPDHEAYLNVWRDLQRAKRQTAANALKVKQQKYDESTDDVDNQINNIPDTQPDHATNGIEAHPLRKRLGAVLFAPQLPQAGTREDIDRRILAMNDLLALCALGIAPDAPSDISGESWMSTEDNEEWDGFSSDEETATEQQASGEVLDTTTTGAVAGASPYCAGRVEEDEKFVDHTDHSPNAASDTETKIGELTTLPGPVCENPSCASTISISWSKTSEGLLCNACRQYRKKHQGRLRPAASLRMPGRRSPSLRRHCANALCGSSSASFMSSGHHASCGWLCEPCAEYFQERGCLPPRPLKITKVRHRRDRGRPDVDGMIALGNSQPANLMALAYSHLRVNSFLLGQRATASMLSSELTPPLTPTSSIFSSKSNQSLSRLGTAMPGIGVRSTDGPFTEPLSLTEQNVNGNLQRPLFDPDLDESPLFSDFDEDYMEFEWSRG